MAEQEVKFTEEEMKTISNLQQIYVNLQNTLGQLSVTRIRLEQKLTDLGVNENAVVEQFKENQKNETNFVEEINKKYGDGNLDLSTGVFTPRPTIDNTEKTL